MDDATISVQNAKRQKRMLQLFTQCRQKPAAEQLLAEVLLH